ncbi:MAG: indole-3-glycerol phosphate synthase TrpC [Dehalococcoidia bacterium]
MIIDNIIATTQLLLEERKSQKPLSELDCICMSRKPPRDFMEALRGPDLNLIAEIKRASPSKGILAPGLDAASLAREYQSAGAAAVSVLTETEYFNGSLDDLRLVQENISIPVLRKDFIIDPYQVWEARASQSDAVLLIAAALPMSDLARLHQAVIDLAMTPLVEIHNLKELEQVLELRPQIIGINNRDLSNFSVNLETTLQLRPLIPDDVIVVSESGIRNREDVERLREAGINAILVGESLVTSENPSSKIRELMG